MSDGQAVRVRTVVEIGCYHRRMAELPIMHAHRAVYDWVDRLKSLRAAYEAACEAEPARADRDAEWLDASLVYHSLRLKGLDVTQEDVHEARRASRTGPGDIGNALAAWSRVRDLAITGAALTPDAIAEINGLLDPDAAGRFRTGAPVAAYAGHSAPGPDVLPALLDNAMDWFTAESFNTDFHPVEQAALALIRICDLQPFPSNNELTARLAASVFTLRAGWLPIIVHHELEAEYRKAILHAVHMDTQPVVDLLVKCAELTYADLGITS